MYRSSKLLIGTVLIASTWFQGCMDRTMSAECKSFFSLPAKEKERLFPTFELDKQLALYRCGMDRRPPSTTWSLLIADRGESIVPILLEKLEKEPDEQFQYGIIGIFEVMSVKGYLRGKFDAILRIRRVVLNMKTPLFRDLAQETLQKIERENAG